MEKIKFLTVLATSFAAIFIFSALFIVCLTKRCGFISFWIDLFIFGLYVNFFYQTYLCIGAKVEVSGAYAVSIFVMFFATLAAFSVFATNFYF